MRFMQKKDSHAMQFGRNVLEFKLAGSDLKKGQFQGYASKWDVLDGGWDIIKKGAFIESIQERGAKGIKMLYQHDAKELIGDWIDIYEDDVGLFVKGELWMDYDPSGRVHYLMMKDALDGLSIGYRAKKWSYDEDYNRILEKVDLLETSVVTFPMLDSARVDDVKSIKAQNDNIERKLHDLEQANALRDLELKYSR